MSLTLVLVLMLVASNSSPGFTPLHMCAKKHDLEGVRLLLEYNANPDIKDNKGWTPLSIAYSEKQQKAKLSSDAEGEVEVESEQMDDEEEVMHCLIEAGANPNQLSFTSRTSPLFEACRVGMERRAEVLIGTIRPPPHLLSHECQPTHARFLLLLLGRARGRCQLCDAGAQGEEAEVGGDEPR
jgi:hypothetical protein